MGRDGKYFFHVQSIYRMYYLEEEFYMTFYLLKIISLLGGLALFLFGMDVMGKALERLAGGRLQTVLAKMSSNV